MTEDELPVAQAPRKRADVWALEKATPDWLFAAASMVARLTSPAGDEWPATPITETAFDNAINVAR